MIRWLLLLSFCFVASAEAGIKIKYVVGSKNRFNQSRKYVEWNAPLLDNIFPSLTGFGQPSGSEEPSNNTTEDEGDTEKSHAFGRSKVDGIHSKLKPLHEKYSKGTWKKKAVRPVVVTRSLQEIPLRKLISEGLEAAEVDETTRKNEAKAIAEVVQSLRDVATSADGTTSTLAKSDSIINALKMQFETQSQAHLIEKYSSLLSNLEERWENFFFEELSENKVLTDAHKLKLHKDLEEIIAIFTDLGQ